MRAVMLVVSVVVCAIAAPAAPAAQTKPAPGFDVVSIKRIATRDGRPRGVVLTESGRLLAPASTAKELIGAAYGVEANQVDGGPPWIGRDPFEIEARAPADAKVDAAMLRLMLRRMLEERFGLVAHAARQPRPVYRLGMQRSDRRLGDRLRRSGPECGEPTMPAARFGGRGAAPPPPPPPPPGAKAAIVLSRLAFRCGTVLFPGHWSIRGLSIPLFALVLEQQAVDRPIVDDTRLTGDFDIDLTFTPETVATASPDQPPIETNAPTLFTALRDQLGLKLEAARLPIDVVIVDRLRAPSEN